MLALPICQWVLPSSCTVTQSLVFPSLSEWLLCLSNCLLAAFRCARFTTPTDPTDEIARRALRPVRRIAGLTHALLIVHKVLKFSLLCLPLQYVSHSQGRPVFGG